ncbi:MAG: spermidine/putrescine ABC transporter substrate-binding protein [Gemmatimonadaceae bacterium]
MSNITRREFVERVLTAGPGLSAVAWVLSSCRREDTASSAGDDLGPIEKELNIYNWSDYIALDTVSLFEKEFGVEVTYDTYESNEEMVAKLQAGASGYDIVVPSGYIMPVLLATGLASPLNRKYLTNWGNLAPMFVNPDFDPGNAHTVPWQWGTTGIAYRRDRIANAPDSWSIFLDPKLRGKMTQLDDGRDVIASWLKYRSHSVNSVDPRELAAAKSDAITAKRNLKAYISAPVKGQLVSGDVWVAQLFSGDAAQAKLEEPAIEFAIPKEGSTIWLDSLMIPASAPHKRAAHEFMNFILRPEVGASISSATGFGTPNQAAMSLMKAPVPYPTPVELSRLEYQRDLGAGAELWDRTWTEIKSA